MNRVLSFGGFYIVASSLAFAGMGVLIKSLGQDATEAQIVFFRNFFAFIILLPILFVDIRGHFSTPALRYHLLRSLFGLASMYCYFHALMTMPLAHAVLLSYSAPLFTPLVAYLWINERSRPLSLIFLAFGFLGILIILGPNGGPISADYFVALASGVFAALAMVSIRKMAGKEPVVRIVFYFSLVSTLVSFFPALWDWKPIGFHTWSILALVGILATLGQYALTKGYSIATVATVGPYTYFTVVFAGVLGWLFWNELPELSFITGAAIVVAVGVLSYRYPNK